jgi:hypothetical protein
VGSRVRELEQPELELFPRARLPRFDNPATDNEKLLTFQARWLEDGDEAARASLWELALVVSVRCCRSAFWKRKLHPCPEAVEDCSMEAVLYVMGRYSSPVTYTRSADGRLIRFRDVYGWNYCVMKDYVSVLAQAVRHAMDYRTKADKIVSFVPAEELNLIAGGDVEDDCLS